MILSVQMKENSKIYNQRTRQGPSMWHTEDLSNQESLLPQEKHTNKTNPFCNSLKSNSCFSVRRMRNHVAGNFTNGLDDCENVKLPPPFRASWRLTVEEYQIFEPHKLYDDPGDQIWGDDYGGEIRPLSFHHCRVISFYSSFKNNF